MTFDLAFWKWNEKTKKRPRAAVVYLLLEEKPLSALVRLDIDRYAVEIGPLMDEAEITLAPKHILLSASHGHRAIDWFVAFAERERLFVFDPQDPDSVTEEDEAEAEKLRNAGGRGAVRFLREQAAAGDLSAMNELGTRHSFGEGVKEDAAAAVEWFTRAALSGHMPAMRNLAECYREGSGVPRDLDRAIGLMKQIIERDPCQPAFELAEWYAELNDRGCAIAYYQLALDHGHPSAKECLAQLGVEAVSDR